MFETSILPYLFHLSDRPSKNSLTALQNHSFQCFPVLDIQVTIIEKQNTLQIRIDEYSSVRYSYLWTWIIRAFCWSYMNHIILRKYWFRTIACRVCSKWQSHTCSYMNIRLDFFANSLNKLKKSFSRWDCLWRISTCFSCDRRRDILTTVAFDNREWFSKI